MTPQGKNRWIRAGENLLKPKTKIDEADGHLNDRRNSGKPEGKKKVTEPRRGSYSMESHRKRATVVERNYRNAGYSSVIFSLTNS